MKRYDQPIILAGILSIAPVIPAVIWFPMLEPRAQYADRGRRAGRLSLLVFVAAMHAQLVYPLRWITTAMQPPRR